MNGLLLDSNVLLWWLTADQRLIDQGWIDRIDSEPGVAVSVVSPWELWIKVGVGKLVLPSTFDAALADARFDWLQITPADSRRAGLLPFVNSDPFDRMIVAQALNRDATIVTGDRTLAHYGVRMIQV